MLDPNATVSFRTTRWTLVRRAQGNGEEARLALSELCAIYYEPVLRFTRRWARGDEDAADLTHGFFEELLEKESPGAADPDRGRFRNYLFGAVRNHLLKHRERESANKRGGGVDHASIDEAEQALGIEDDQDFDRDWALASIRQAHEELRQEMALAGREDFFEALRPWLDGGVAGDAAAAATALGLSANAFKVAVHRLRERFREKVRGVIAATLDDPAELQAEFRHLVETLVRGGVAQS